MKSKRSNSLSKRGFLLLEVMISIVILASGLIFIARTYTVSRQNVKYSTEKIKSCFIADSIIWKYEITNYIYPGTEHGTTVIFNEDCQWQIIAQNIESTDLNYTRLIVKKDDKDQGFEIDTYFFNKEK